MVKETHLLSELCNPKWYSKIQIEVFSMINKNFLAFQKILQQRRGGWVYRLQEAAIKMEE